MSIDFDLSAESFAFASMFTQVIHLGSIPFAFASAGHIGRAPSAAGLPIFLPGKSLMPLMPELFSQYRPWGELAYTLNTPTLFAPLPLAISTLPMSARPIGLAP